MATNTTTELLTREAIEERERDLLCPWAAKSGDSLGRLHSEREHSHRTAFQRDRDRLIHSTAFRRLEYKTQVFVNHEGDYYRTRLTHTLEVVQIARSLARFLRLNEDLVEAMALAHDLGHTPFGHSVEGFLNELMAEDGGFEHNAQGLRCVDLLESPYPDFLGLNLTYEVRRIFTKKTSMANLRRQGFAAPESERFEQEITRLPLEAQVVDLADSVAYNSHDVDDGLKSGLLSLEALQEVPLWNEVWGQVRGRNESTRRHEAIRQLINREVQDIAEETLRRMSAPEKTEVSDRKEAPPLSMLPKLVDFSPEMKKQDTELKRVLRNRLYQHPQVARKMEKARRMIGSLFETYSSHPDQMAREFAERARVEPVKRVVCDYIAGMTDRFAEEEYLQLVLPDSVIHLSR
jgi:dGTPase